MNISKKIWILLLVIAAGVIATIYLLRLPIPKMGSVP